MARVTQGQRILRVLRDGRWHTTAEIHRRAGYSRLNSRISELRRQGQVIDCEHLPGKGMGARAYRYIWRNPDVSLTLAVDEAAQPDDGKDEVPRTPATRYRIYVVPRYGEQTLLDTAPTPEELGKKIVALGEKAELEGCCLGILDSHGVPKEVRPGKWLLNPHEARW